MARAQVFPRTARSILTRTGGYLAGFTHTLQPYAGCQFSCAYCYVREMAVQRTNPHGLPWSRWIAPKLNAPALLEREAARGRLASARIFCFSASALFWSPTSAMAQAADTVLTLSDARSLLSQNSPGYRAALASADATGEGVWSAWGRWLPTADLRVSLSRNEFTTRTFVDPTGVAVRLEGSLDSPLTPFVSFPMVLGHEIVGEVIEVGSAVDRCAAPPRSA